MSSAADMQVNGEMEHVLRSRASKVAHPQVLRAQDEEKPNGNTDGGSHQSRYTLLRDTSSESHSILTMLDSSGTSTPAPADAPPSVQSISTARRQIRAQQKHRLFPSIDYAARLSHFDPNSEHRDFQGFFALFWVGLAIMVITTMLRNIKDTGYPMRVKIWALFTEDMWQLALSDGAMVASTGLSLPLHLLFRRSDGWLRWGRGGMWIQSVFQFAWLVYWVR
jgi:sterol O-acyltransferase